jgi:hypothetical protein
MSDDRLLTWLVLGAIGVTLFSTFLTLFMLNDAGTQVASVTGRVTDTGTATTTLAGSAGVSVVSGSAEIAFGSGYYNASCTQGYADLTSDPPSSDCWINTTAFPTESVSHKIRNSGTTLLNVTVDSDKTDGETLFCGSTGGCLSTNTAGVKYNSDYWESNSCNTEMVSSFSDMLTYNGEISSTLKVCDNLNYEDENDEVKISYEFLVPADATSGAKTLTVTYTGVAL